MSDSPAPRTPSTGALGRATVLLALVLLAVAAPLPLLAADEGPERAAVTATWPVREAVTTLWLDPAGLAAFGIAVEDVGRSLAGYRSHELSVAPTESSSFAAVNAGKLGITVAWDGFRGFTGGPIRHRGGVRLVGPTRAFDLGELTLRPGADPTTLELIDAGGEVVLATAEAQWIFDADRGALTYLNADLRVQPALARQLGDHSYVGHIIGLLALDATVAAGVLPAVPETQGTPPPCGDWSGDVDVGLVNMSSIAQAGGGIGVVNGRSVAVVLPSAELENVGTANVPWYSKFTNLGVPPWNDQHPFLVWHMSRVRDGILEPLGKSDLKHAFLTINSGCEPGACTDSHVLGIGCADVYSTGTNNSVGSLAPRAEVSALTGIWAHCGGIPSHFDTNGDCVQDFSGSGENTFTHGLKAAEDDLGSRTSGLSQSAGVATLDSLVSHGLQTGDSVRVFGATPGDYNGTFTVTVIDSDTFTYSVSPAAASPATVMPRFQDAAASFYVEAWYIVRNDINIFNSMGYRQVTPSKPGSVWSFPTVGAYTMGPAINAWVAPTGHPATDENTLLDTGEGRVQLVVRTFDLGGGVHRYAYALQNHDFDRKIDSFRVPFYTAGATISNITYVDNDGIAANNWTSSVDPTGVTWTAPAGGELDYASLLAFRFDVDRAPATIDAFLGVSEAGSPESLQISTLTPITGAPPASDFYTVAPCRLLDTRTGTPSPIPSNSVRSLDVVAVAACGVPAGAFAVALNVTAVTPPSSGELAVYAGAVPPSPGTLSFNAGVTRANNAIIMLTLDGELRLRPSLTLAGSLHVVVDVVGYFTEEP